MFVKWVMHKSLVPENYVGKMEGELFSDRKEIREAMYIDFKGIL